MREVHSLGEAVLREALLARLITEAELLRALRELRRARLS